MLSVVVRTVSRGLHPFIILFGIYIMVHGHLTPGGAFPAGVIIASFMILMVFAFGADRTEEEREVKWDEVLESYALIAILGLFLFAILLTKVFPWFKVFTGAPGTLFSGGAIPLLNISGGIEVSAALIIIFLSMLLMKGSKK